MYALPAIAAAKPVGTFGFLVSDLDDQVDPAIDGQFVVYAGREPNGIDFDVFLRDIGAKTPEPKKLAASADSPDVFQTTAIYRTHQRGPSGQDVQRIVVEAWPTGNILLAPPAAGAVSSPVVHSAVVAWEQQNGATGMDIMVARCAGSCEAPYVRRSDAKVEPLGDQHSPAVFEDLVAYVDEQRGGSVWLHDSGVGPLDGTQICDGPATGVSIGKAVLPGDPKEQYVVAVARSGTPDAIEIYVRGGGKLPFATLSGPHLRNPHLSGDWVAFDDHSGVFSQVVVWRWNTPPGDTNLVFVPHPSQTDQRLNDLTLLLADEVRVVFEDSASPASGRDIALYRLPVNPIVFDGEPNGWPIVPAPPKPVDCASKDATVLATLVLDRTKGKPDEGSKEFDVDPPNGGDTLPVLVCIEARHVSSAWVLLDDDAVARPDDFDSQVRELSKPAVVEKGHRRLSARLEGKPGSRLTVRVLADPSRTDVCRDDDDDDGHGHGHDRHEGRRRCGGEDGAGPTAGAPAAPAPSERSGGCGNAGTGLSLAALAALLVRRRLRV